MNKNKVLNKINKLIQEGNNLLENKEYYDLNHNSKETGVLMLLPNSCGYKVDEEIFSKWESEINVFLYSNKKFTASLSDFKKSKLRETSEDTTKRYISILEGLKNNIEDDTIEFEDLSRSFEKKQNSIFIGHGRSNLWNEVVRMLKDDCELDCINYFEKETHAGKFIGDALREFNRETTFAIIVMTAEDETSEGELRARQNVIHEIGFFQGKLGFEKVAILKQKQVESSTNIDGLQYIEFDESHIKQTFYELQKMLKREKIIK